MVAFCLLVYLMPECEIETDFGLSFATENTKEPDVSLYLVRNLGMCLSQFFLLSSFIHRYILVENPSTIMFLFIYNLG